MSQSLSCTAAIAAPMPVAASTRRWCAAAETNAVTAVAWGRAVGRTGAGRCCCYCCCCLLSLLMLLLLQLLLLIKLPLLKQILLSLQIRKEAFPMHVMVTGDLQAAVRAGHCLCM